MRSGTHNSGAYTLVEVLITVMILGILATIAVDAVANSEANLRAERAAREAVGAVRFARSRAMSDGVPYKVRFDVGNKVISVIDPNNGNAALAAPTGAGTMTIALSGKTEVANVGMACAITGAATDPYDVAFTPNGGTINSGTVTFTYGVSTKVLQIPSVGDPIVVGDIRRP